MSGLTVSASTAWPHEYCISISQSIVPSTSKYLLPNQSVHHLKFPACLGGGGGGFLTVAPSRTAASAVVPVSTSTTSATKYRAVPVIFCLQVTLAVISAPVPVSPVGSPISAAIIFLLVGLVHSLPSHSDIMYYQIVIVSSYRRMRACAGSNAVSL